MVCLLLEHRNTYIALNEDDSNAPDSIVLSGFPLRVNIFLKFTFLNAPFLITDMAELMMELQVEILR